MLLGKESTLEDTAYKTSNLAQMTRNMTDERYRHDVPEASAGDQHQPGTQQLTQIALGSSLLRAGHSKTESGGTMQDHSYVWPGSGTICGIEELERAMAQLQGLPAGAARAPAAQHSHHCKLPLVARA